MGIEWKGAIWPDSYRDAIEAEERLGDVVPGTWTGGPVPLGDVAEETVRAALNACITGVRDSCAFPPSERRRFARAALDLITTGGLPVHEGLLTELEAAKAEGSV
jgi:hypothetical protein